MKVKMTRPESCAIRDYEPYVIGDVKNGAGPVVGIEGASDIHRAQRARDNIADHEERNGRDPTAIRIFRRDDIEWVEK
jgi:hypothetical protein